MADEKSIENNSNNSNLEEKLDKIGKIIQDFGLNFIQNIGELKHAISMLTDKINKVSDTLVDLKGLKVLLEEVSKFKQDINSKLVRIESLIKARNMPNMPFIDNMGNINIDGSMDQILNEFKNNLKSFKNTVELKENLEKLKEKLFEITGGHRVLFEIKNEIQNIKDTDELSEELINKITEKIHFWINKLKE
ncbi:MAG: hypothetical protein ACTSRZ_04510 [Promethearchaeota archaeon]